MHFNCVVVSMLFHVLCSHQVPLTWSNWVAQPPADHSPLFNGTNQQTNRAQKIARTISRLLWHLEFRNSKFWFNKNWERTSPSFTMDFWFKSWTFWMLFVEKNTGWIVGKMYNDVYPPLMGCVFLRFSSQWLFRRSSIFHQVGSCGSMTCHGHVVLEWLTLQSSKVHCFLDCVITWSPESEIIN